MKTMTPFEELAERFATSKEPSVECSCRLPRWLKEELEHQVARLRGRGIPITRSAVMTEALIQFLGVRAPNGTHASDHPDQTGINPS
jgi:hypothetical protein